MRHSRQRSSALVAEIANKADKCVIGSRQGLDVVGLIVSTRARESLAAAQGDAAILGEDHLDAIDIGWIDDSRDIKVGRARIAVPADFSQHAGDIGGTIAERVPVPDPGFGEVNTGCTVTLEDEGRNSCKTCLGSEDNIACRAVLVDEVDSVGRSQGEESRSGGEGCCELHLEFAKDC